MLSSKIELLPPLVPLDGGFSCFLFLGLLQSEWVNLKGF